MLETLSRKEALCKLSEKKGNSSSQVKDYRKVNTRSSQALIREQMVTEWGARNNHFPLHVHKQGESACMPEEASGRKIKKRLVAWDNH